MKYRKLRSFWYLIAFTCFRLYDQVLMFFGRTYWMPRYITFKKRIGVVNKDGAPLHCYKCAHDKFKETVTDTINHTVSEYKSECERCGTENGYWAYGSWTYV
jgi:hypothetical protein